MIATNEHQKLIELLKPKAGKKLRIKRSKGNLYDLLSTECGFEDRDVKRLLLDLQAEGLVSFSKPATLGGMPLGGTLEVLLSPPPPKDYELKWDQAFKDFGFPEEIRKKFKGVAHSFRNFSLDESIKILEGLVELSDPKHHSLSKYTASATFLLGSSKLLDRIDKRLLDYFWVTPEGFLPSPKYISVAGTANPRAVILVENPNSFETVVAQQIPEKTKTVWLCSYGFGLGTEKSNQSGILLESNLTVYRRHSIVLVRSGTPPKRIEDLMGNPNLFFWGDLDLSGLRIYDNLKKHYPHLQLSALYQPMIAAFQEGHSLSYTATVEKKGQQCHENSMKPLSDPLAQKIAKICAERSIDQEYVSSGFENIAAKAFNKAFV